jgi:hypothetical protein
MPSHALASHNSGLSSRENLRPVSIDLEGNPRHVENRTPAPAVNSGTVKWSTARKNFTVLKLSDNREAFLHRDDFSGDWPVPYHARVRFEYLIPTPDQRCKWRAKDAMLAEAK